VHVRSLTRHHININTERLTAFLENFPTLIFKISSLFRFRVYHLCLRAHHLHTELYEPFFFFNEMAAIAVEKSSSSADTNLPTLTYGQDGTENTTNAPPTVNTRPPIVYTSPGAFAKSFAARWRSVWTKRFILSLLAGQLLSLCITCTNVTTTELVNRGWTLSTTQGFFL